MLRRVLAETGLIGSFRDETGVVQWNPDALDDDPDVAEVSSRPSKPRPRWLIRLGVWVVVVAVAALVLWRLTADKATASLQQVRFVTKYAAEVDFVATNKSGDDLYVLPRVADRAGFEVAGTTVRGKYYDGAPTPVGIGRGGTEAISVRVAVTDCALAAGAGASDAELELTILVGPYSGSRDTVEVGGTMPSWSSLLPPVCDDAADRGIASLADVDVAFAQPGSASAVVRIQNTGGRSLTFLGATLPEATGTVNVSRRNSPKTLAPGRTTTLVVAVSRDGCRVAGDGPAIVVLQFSGGASPSERLQVELDASWTNLLGPCPAVVDDS